MRRSQAPSMVAKRKSGETENDPNLSVKLFATKPLSTGSHNPKRSCVKRIALSPIKNKFEWAPYTKTADEIANQTKEHEVFIQRILSKPFRIPILNYNGTFDSVWVLFICFNTLFAL